MTLKEFLRFRGYQARCRRKRGEIFKQYLKPKEEDRILDLGGGTGAHISQLLPFINTLKKHAKKTSFGEDSPKEHHQADREWVGGATPPFGKDIYIADIDKNKLKKSAKKGFKTIVLNEDGTIPCEDGYFDIIFCSSVIEHVTVDKRDMETVQTNKEFREAALKRQKKLAQEIERVGKSYFVQTPYKYFPLESHSRLPVILVLLPRKLQIKIIKLFRQFWFARTSPDWNLLTVKDMKFLFPGAKIIKEKAFFFTKSLMAIKARVVHETHEKHENDENTGRY